VDLSLDLLDLERVQLGQSDRPHLGKIGLLLVGNVENIGF